MAAVLDLPAPVESPLRRFVADFLASRIAVAGLVLLLAVIAIALLAPVLAPQNPYDLAKLDLLDSRLASG
jgi:peptide/nickel transport system permease protein